MHIPVVGIVAEYNPLHRGHKHHIEQALSKCGAEAAVAVLSSDFVQRGEPSIVNKWKRTEMALSSGADLVLELPAVFSSHNAGVFASAAVDVLGASQIVTHLAFGLENPNWQLDKILDIVIEEPKPFKFLLKEHLEKGYSFVEARASALEILVPGTAEMLRGSNNTLALAYLKQIRKKGYNMIPVPIQRIGASYNDDSLGYFSSATAIRKAISRGKIGEALAEMPQGAAEILRGEIEAGHAYLESDKLWRLLRTVLLRTPPEQIAKIAEVNEGIEYKLIKAAYSASSFEEWADNCTSKRYPMGRIKRHGVHILLSVDHWSNRAFQRLGPPYIRVLGVRNRGRELLRLMKSRAALPIVTRCGDAARVSAYAKKIMDYDILAAETREELTANPQRGLEHKRRIIMDTV